MIKSMLQVYLICCWLFFFIFFLFFFFSSRRRHTRYIGDWSSDVCSSDLLHAWELKALAGTVDMLFTGRMHLAIGAFGMGKPALCVAYRQKFEGLFQHFSVESLTLEPGRIGDTAFVLQQLDAFEAKRIELAEAISAKLPEVKAASARNFEFLE